MLHLTCCLIDFDLPYVCPELTAELGRQCKEQTNNYILLNNATGEPKKVDVRTCHELCTFQAHRAKSIGCCEHRQKTEDCYWSWGESSIIIKDNSKGPFVYLFKF